MPGCSPYEHIAAFTALLWSIMPEGLTCLCGCVQAGTEGSWAIRPRSFNITPQILNVMCSY